MKLTVFYPESQTNPINVRTPQSKSSLGIHFTLSDFITLITSQEEYKLWHTSLTIIPQSPVMLPNYVHNKIPLSLK